MGDIKLHQESIRFRAKVEQVAEARADDDVHRYSSVDGARRVQDVGAQLPALGERPGEFSSFPARALDHQTMIWHSKAFDRAAKAVGLSAKNPGVSKWRWAFRQLGEI